MNVIAEFMICVIALAIVCTGASWAIYIMATEIKKIYENNWKE